MQFGPATRNRLAATNSLSQAPRFCDSGSSPSPIIDA